MNGEPQTSWLQIIGMVLGAIGWVVGIVAGYIELKSYSDQKKLEKGYLNILEQAKRDWEGKYTEEQIKDLAQELARLQEMIQKDVPRQARRAFLEDQLATVSDNIGELYSRHAQLAKELDKQPNSSFLPPELKNAIETTIMPSYIARQRKQQIIYWLLVVVLIILIVVNYGFIMKVMSLRIPIKGSEIRVGFILWFCCIATFVTYAFSKLSKGRFIGWLIEGTYLAMIAFAIICFLSALSLIILVLLGNGWMYGNANSEEWVGLSLVMLILSIPIAFLSLTTIKFIENSVRRKREQVLGVQRIESPEAPME